MRGIRFNPKLCAGFLLAFLIGVGCRLLNIPLPAPTALLGALIVLALTSGYLVTDRVMTPTKMQQDDA